MNTIGIDHNLDRTESGNSWRSGCLPQSSRGSGTFCLDTVRALQAAALLQA